MNCSGKNVIKNGDFRQGLTHWSGKNIFLAENKSNPRQNSVLLQGEGSRLSQIIPVSFEQGCAYYLYFDILNLGSKNVAPQLVASVSDWSRSGQMLLNTPLLVKPPQKGSLEWFDYFSIVPPASSRATFTIVSFLVQSGNLHIRNIRLASHGIKPIPPSGKA